jgi:hypothetical protein
MLDQRDQEERIQARGQEYFAGEMSEAQFSAYLFGMKLRGEDIRHKMREYAPPAPAQSFEEHRLDVSRQWLKERAKGGTTP